MIDKDKEKLLLREMKNLLDTADAAGRDLTTAELARYEEIEKELDEETPYRPNFKAGAVQNNLILPPGPKTWQQVFNKSPQKAEISFGEFLQRVSTGQIDARMLVLQSITNTVTEGTGTEGGFAIPEQWWSQIFTSAFEVSVAAQFCRILPMQSNTLNVPGWDSDDQTKGAEAEIEMEWLSEEQTATRKTPKLRTVAYDAKKAGIYIGVSNEALEDSQAVSASISPLMANAVAFGIDKGILRGSGINQPYGVLTAPATIPVGRAAAGAIAFADVTALLGRMLPSSLKRCVWVASPDAFAAMLRLETSSGSGQLILQSGPGPASSLPFTLFGRPYLISEKLPALGSKGDLMLCDFGYYGLAMRSGARLEKTQSAQWLQDVTDYRLLNRCTGKPLIHLPFSPAGGGNTISPFLVLDE